MRRSSGEMFRSIVRGSNFMTPYFIGHYLIKNGEVEVTWGFGLSRETIYGVTVERERKHDFDASKMCTTEEEVVEYIKSLM